MTRVIHAIAATFVGLIFGLIFAAPAIGHDVPIQLPPPESPAEAWNVVEQSKANINQLILTELMRDVGPQLANIATALRAMDQQAASTPAAQQVHELSGKLLTAEAGLLQASRDATDSHGNLARAWADWCKILGQLEALYPAETVKADVFICPMHPLERHLQATDKCAACGMSLVLRKLPASAVYQKPGEPTMKLTASCAPLVVGREANVVMRLSRRDGSPVALSDLLEMHTKKIHLLINDRSLGDYHHVHPEPTDTPGEYRFSFTPSQPGPYRMWADVVPAATSVQEYDIADLPADTAPQPIADRHTRLSTDVGGRHFDLTFQTAGARLRAGQTIIGTITITDPNGKPCTSLEPVMGAFAHLVGFSEDGKSVLHIHPYGKEPTGPDDRAGPTFAFKFYAPAPGFLRLYCQIQIDGRDVFAPFNLNVEPTR